MSLPYVLQSTPASADVCMPVLAGKVTVQPNSQKVVIPAQTFAPLDRQIVVRNQRLNREFYYPHNVADYRFLVDGTGTDKFKVTVIGRHRAAGTVPDASGLDAGLRQHRAGHHHAEPRVARSKSRT